MPRKTVIAGAARAGAVGFNEAAARCRGKPAPAAHARPRDARLQ